MITHYLGREEVAGYAHDLAKRLVALGDGFPTVWCPIGHSGDKLLRVIASALPEEFAARVQVVQLFYSKGAQQITLNGAVPEDLSGAHAIVIDSSVHSGKSMLAASRFVSSSGAKSVLSYSLVVKRTSSVLPHYFGVIVSDHDRVLFQLDDIPNNRLFVRKYEPMGLFRRIESGDVNRQMQSLDTGVKSIDKISLGDLFYEHRVNNFDVVLVEDREHIAGFIKIRLNQKRGLLVDVIASDRRYQGRGVGGALMRYAETLARSHECTHIELWSIDGKVTFYEDFGFIASGEEIDTGHGEVFHLMRRQLLYHFELQQID